jgi:hypothetical protein
MLVVWLRMFLNTDVISWLANRTVAVVARHLVVAVTGADDATV